MPIEKNSNGQNVRSLHKKRDSLNFDLAVQRKSNIWKIEQKSLFIHSLICGYPIPPFFVTKDEEGNRSFIDGKQRMTTVFGFIEGNFSLGENTPDAEGEEIAGKLFKDLSNDMQETILNTNFNICTLEEVSEDDIDEIFYRLNNGSPLNKMELSRALAGSNVMTFVNEIASKKFISEIANLTEGTKQRFGDQEVILQSILLLTNEEIPALSGKQIQELAQKLRQEGLSEEIQTIIRNTVDYLEKAFLIKEKYLIKLNLPMLFMMAVKAQEDNIVAEKFGGWAQSLFNNDHRNKAYKNCCVSGTASKDKVKKRLDFLKKDYTANINSAPDYTIPEPKEATGKRGRPKKVEQEQATNDQEPDQNGQEQSENNETRFEEYNDEQAATA